MRAGKKPLAMFFDEYPEQLYPAAGFNALVKKGLLIRHEQIETLEGRDFRRIIYALPTEAWRIEALLALKQAHYFGWDPNVERITGALLGYSQDDIEDYVKRGPFRKLALSEERMSVSNRSGHAD
jgi:hypothetical protein